jgi:hypothetical protein
MTTRDTKKLINTDVLNIAWSTRVLPDATSHQVNSVDCCFLRSMGESDWAMFWRMLDVTGLKRGARQIMRTRMHFTSMCLDVTKWWICRSCRGLVTRSSCSLLHVPNVSEPAQSVKNKASVFDENAEGGCFFFSRLVTPQKSIRPQKIKLLANLSIQPWPKTQTSTMASALAT